MGAISIDMGREEVQATFGPAAVNLTRRRAEEIKQACQDECPIDTGTLRESHYVEQISYRQFEIVADTDYAMAVHDGQGPEGPRRPNRWMNRGLDRVAALHG